MAAEAAHGAEKAEAAAGLPQLDPTFFPSQLLWLSIFFVVLYLLLSWALLPKLSGVIKAREDKVRGDIDAAAKANAAAQDAKTAYERSLAEAKAGARKLADEVRAEANAARAKASGEADAKLAKRLDDAEARLAAQRGAGLEAARLAAADAARAIVAKLTGVEIADADAKRAAGEA